MVYVIQHDVFSKIFYLLTLINFESSIFLLLPFCFTTDYTD